MTAPGDTLIERCRKLGLLVRQGLSEDSTEIELGEGTVARLDGGDVDRLAQVLEWMRGDLDRQHGDKQAITLFTRKLSESYEQVSLLYDLANSMERLDTPQEYLHLACRRLHETLEFNWVALRFLSLPMLGPALANRTIAAGPMPTASVPADRLADELGKDLDTRRTTVLDPSSSELASLLGSEAVVSLVSFNGQVVGLLLAGGKGGDDPDVSSIDTQLINATAEVLGTFISNVVMYHRQHTMFLGTIGALSAAIDAKDRYTRGHSERVAHLACMLAKAHGLDSDEIERIRLAGLLHDIGKIGVPEAVLHKPGRLTDEEFALVKEHPRTGYNILKDIEMLRDVLPGVLHHHERFDGDGYPDGLSREDIPLQARVLAIADTFDAMSSDRSYRVAIPRAAVIEEIHRSAGGQLDPTLTELFVRLDLTTYDAMLLQARDVRTSRAA
jgi:HD-GYP domain-containing protein (c-di-GMP phosphodiesterase class II)